MPQCLAQLGGAVMMRAFTVFVACARALIAGARVSRKMRFISIAVSPALGPARLARAGAAEALPVRADHLKHDHVLLPQEPGEGSAIAAGPSTSTAATDP